MWPQLVTRHLGWRSLVLQHPIFQRSPQLLLRGSGKPSLLAPVSGSCLSQASSPFSVCPLHPWPPSCWGSTPLPVPPLSPLAASENTCAPATSAPCLSDAPLCSASPPVLGSVNKCDQPQQALSSLPSELSPLGWGAKELSLPGGSGPCLG